MCVVVLWCILGCCFVWFFFRGGDGLWVVVEFRGVGDVCNVQVCEHYCSVCNMAGCPCFDLPIKAAEGAAPTCQSLEA